MPENYQSPEELLFNSIKAKTSEDLLKHAVTGQTGNVQKPSSKPVPPSIKELDRRRELNASKGPEGYTMDNALQRSALNLSGGNATPYDLSFASGQTDTKNNINTTNYGEYDMDSNISIDSSITQSQLDMMRADEQSFGAEAANTIMGAIVKAPIKLASSFSSFLVDTDSYSKLNDSMWNQVMKNSTETLNQMDEKVGDVFKIHGADDQTDGTFGNREWWMKNAFQEGGAYLLGFMAAGAGTSALMARVAQGSSAVFAGLATRVYNAASAGGKIEKAAVAARAMLPSIRSGLQGAGDLASAYMLSDLEAGAEALSVADEVYKEKYTEFLKRGGWDADGVVPISVQEEADKYAGQIAANAGDVTRNIGRMTMVFNMTGLKYFTGSKLSTTKYVKHTALTALKDIGLEIPQEMGEELLMGVGGALARRQASENLTAENGGGFLSHSHLVSDTWNHVFSQQGAEEAVLGGVLGGLFGAIGEGVKAKSGANKSNNDLADFQASNTTEAGYLKQLLDPKSQISQSIMNLKNLSDAQSDLFPKITEAHLKGDEVSANNMRAQLLQFQAYDYFQKGMGDQLNATMEALTSDKQLAEETFGPDYHEKLTEAKKIIKEAQGVYDTEVPFATPGTEKMLYHNILNRNNISKAIHDVRIDLSKHRQQYIQDLANYTAEGLGVPSMEGLNYDVSKQEEEFKTSNPLSLQKVTENETKLAELQSQFKQNQAQHNLIRKGKYNEFETAAKVKGTTEYTTPIVKQEAKLTKEQEITNNTKAQEAQSLANDIQDESKPEVTKDTVDQGLDKKIAEIDTQVANEEITLEEAEVEKAKIQEVKAEVIDRAGEPEYELGDHAKVKELANRISKEGYSNDLKDQQLATNYPKLLEKYLNEIKAESIELTQGFNYDDVSGTIPASNVDSEGNIHSPIVKTTYSEGFNKKNEIDLAGSTSNFTEGDSIYKVFYHQDGTITYQVAEETNTLNRVKYSLKPQIENACEYIGSFKTGSKISTLEPGVLKEENGKLVIVKKAKIEYSDTLKPFDGTIVGKVEAPKVKPVIEEVIAKETVDKENGVLGDNDPMIEVPEGSTTEEVASKPTKKLVYVPTSISVKTVSSKDNAITVEASNEGGEAGADIDKVQASNVLDNSENSIQIGTNLLITPTVVVGKNAYQFTTEDGRLAGYLHEPAYVRESRVAVDKVEDAEAEILRQKEELAQMWANLDTHFSATSEPYKTVVTGKTPGTINTTKSDNKVKPEILADSRVVVIPIITDSSQPNKNKLNLAEQEINEYLEKIGGILDDASYEQLTEAKGAEGNHVILVPTAARLGGKIVYNYYFADRTVLSDNKDVLDLVKKIITNYLEGNPNTNDQRFVQQILTRDIEFDKFVSSGKPKVMFKDKSLITIDRLKDLDNIGIRMPLSYKHNQTVTIAGQEFVPQQFIGGTLKSNLNYSTLLDGTTSYVMNPVISFEPIVLSSSVVPAMEEVEPVKKKKPPVKKDIYNSPKDVEENPLLSLDRLSTEGGFNIIKKQEIVKAISVLLFRFITKKSTDNSVSDVLKGLKEDLVDSRDLHEYFVESGLEQEDIDNGFLDNVEHNQAVVDNLNYTLENWNTLSDNALNLLKETGYNLKKDTRDLSTAEIKPNPEEISDKSIQNDTADTVDSALVDKPEEASSSKYDKMMFEESMYEVSSAFVRTWLNSIGSGKKSVIGGVDSYGGKKLFGELLNKFKDSIYTEEDFKAIITKEGLSKPQFADLAKKFDTLDPHYKVQILNSLDVTKANFRAVNPKGVFDSNRNTKEIQLKEMVNQGLQALFNEGVGGQPNTLSGYGQAYMTKLNALLENTGKADVLADVEVISILGDLGVPVTKEVLARLKADKKAFGRTLLEGIQNSIEAGQKAQTLDEVKMQDKLYYVLVGAPANTTKINLQEYIIESDGDSIVTVEGKKVYPFGIHHATSKLWANLKDRVKGSALIANLKSVPFISENTWLASEKFGQIIYMDGVVVKEDSKAKTYADMTTNEKLMAKFEFFTRSTASNDTYSYWSSAKSDKSVVLGIEAPKITSSFELAVSKVIAAEAKRINQFAKLPKEKGVDGSVFYLFPWLNDMPELFLETANGREVDEKFLQPGYSKLQGYAKKIINAEKDAFIKEYLRSGAKLTDDVKKQIEAFVTSELVNNYNFLSLVSGDPAYFAKLNKNGSVNIPKTMANLFKRLTRDIATAKRGRGVYKELKVITFTEPKDDHKISKNIDQLEALLGSQQTEKGLNKKGEMEYDTFGYRKVEAADAQGYCTVKEYWDLLYGDGLISLERRDALCKQFDEHFESQGTVEGLIYTEADLDGILIKPRKPVTIGNKFSKIGDSPVNRPIYIKYSIFPLLPQLLATDSPLIKLCDFMEKNGVHRAVAESGFKVGSAKPVDIEADVITATDDQFTVVDREMDGNQLDIPYDETKESNLQGTQLLKLVFDGVEEGVEQLRGTQPSISAKEGVSELFDSNPELAAIGTTEQYSQYLDTVFPDSKVKDIVYHGSKGKKFDKIDPKKSIWSDGVFYVTSLYNYAKSYAGQNGSVIPLIINSKVIKRVQDGYAVSAFNKEMIQEELYELNSSKFKASYYGEEGLFIKVFDTQVELDDHIKSNSGWEIADISDVKSKTTELEKELNSEPYDTILTNVEGGGDVIYAIFKTEQAHILGSEQDIEGFKDFVSGKATTQSFNNVEEDDLKTTFYANQARLLDKMDADYKTKMGIGEVNGKFQIVDMGKFKKELATALSDSFENPNDKVSFDTVGDKFKLPLFFNKLGPKIESTLIQGFKKKVLKSKLGGRSFVLVSEYLFKGNTGVIATTPSYDPEKGLLPARLMKGDRLATAEEVKAHYANPTENPLTVAPAQVMIAWNFKDENGNLLKMSDYVKNGKLDMDKIDPEMLKMVGYRIPTQGHNSMSVCEVVGFLPAYMGDTVIASKDWIVQMGSDFDIDKVFMHFKYSTVKDGKIVADSKEGSEKALKNEIIDNYMTVLSKTEVFKKMMIPLDFGSLPNIVKELQKIDRFKESQGSILSPVTQVNNYETGTAGKVGVGMSSLLSVFASIIQGKGLSVREGLSIKVGDKIIDLSDLSSPNQLLDPTKSKNMVISAFQSASVDNIKELLVKTINYNSETHPLLISMSLLGLDEEWISYMMVQEPKSLQPFYEAIKGFEPQPLTLELLKQGVTNPDSLTPYEKANLYHHYDSFKLLGDEISKLSGLVNITTNGFGTYFEDINYLQESSSILYNSRALEEGGMNRLIQDGFWGKGWKFMQNTQDVIGQLFPVKSSLYKSIMAYGNSEEFIKYPTKEYKKALKNFVKAYMMSDLSMFGGSVTEQRQRLFYGDNSLAHRASVLKADNPKNSFLQSLSFSFSKDGIKPNLVKYIGKGLTVTEKFLWQQQLKEMFYSENPVESEFAKDFIIYQYAAGGIQVPTSAISMLPSDLTRLMKLDEDVSKIDWDGTSTDTINDILTQFKQSNKDKYKFIEQPDKSQGFFGMMTVVKNIEPSIIEEVVVNEVKTLDEALTEQAEGKFKGIIEDLGQLEPTTVEYVDSAEINDNAGEYDRGTGVIKIATDISKEAQAKTLIHETLHHVLSATTKAYNEYKATGNPGKLTQEGIAAMRRMERVFTVAKENFAKKGGPKRLENTLLNLDEFMSDMVSEKAVQKWANEIEVSGESLWSKFKKLASNILQSLGLVKLKEGSLLEAFLDTYLEVKENRVVGNGKGKLNSPKKTSKYNKFTVMVQVNKMSSERKRYFLQHMGESTKLNPLDVKYLNETDFDNHYFITYKGNDGRKVVSKASVDKMGDYLVAKEKSYREISYTQKNISEIIKDVANSDRPLAGLAKHLVKYIDLVKPKIEFSTDLRLPNHATESGFGDKAEGLYNNKTNVISVNLGVNHHKGLEYTILHEYMHALTAHEIRRGGPKVDALKDLYNKAKDSLKNKELHPNTKYALLDWDEFIVGIFTNGMFIKELQSLPATGVKYKNLWENVLDSLLNILGITKKDSFYEEAFALATNIVEDHISYEEMMKRQEEFSNFVEDQFEDSQFSAGDTMQSIEDFFNNCK